MRVGYARVSTPEQSIDAQLERLCDCEKIFSEKLSGKKDDRPQLAAALEFIREGDTLVATRLDRLARSVTHLCTIVEILERKSVALQILDQAIDTTTPSGMFLFHMLAAVAEFELTLRKEAQRAGIAHARAVGVHTGRPYKLTDDKRFLIGSLRDEGTGTSEIARRVHLDRSTVYRVLATLRESQNSSTYPTPVSAEG
jgi:DNA invertase Pin-like site-specific DNA recombinase